jgi:adenosylcobyric acid synthase
LVAVQDSFARLSAQHDLVIVEGAGSAAEVNLRKGDIANMGFACAGNIPVILAGDIDRGGVIAQIVGTKAVLDDQDRAQIAGFLINRFRGDPRLFDEGYRYIAEQTGWRGFGVVPWFGDAWKLPAEDGVDLGKTPTHDGAFHVAALAFPRISNFDDLDPIAQDPKLRLTWVEAGRVTPADADLVILPGSKSTRADLEFLRAQGWDVDLAAHRRRGGAILGLCGGYQMLGRRISDPEGLDGAVGVTEGLGLLEIETLMRPQKRLALSAAQHVPTGAAVSGYEIHMGETSGPDCTRPFAALVGHKDGAISADGRVMGSYLHGLFQEDGFRTAFFAGLGAEISAGSYRAQIGAVLDDLAQHLETHLDVDAIFDLAR